MLFISYSRLDNVLVGSVSKRLDALGARYWLDTAEIPVGEAFVVRIGQALTRCHDLMLVDTPASRRSYWVSREVGAAVRRRREGRLRQLLRLKLDPSDGDSAVSFDTVIEGEDDWRKIESLLKMAPPQATLERDVTTLEPLLATDDIGQPAQWVGRQEELERLDVWWRSGSPVAWVDGHGGLGKSGLIRTWIAAFNALGYESENIGATSYISGRDLRGGMDALEKWVGRHQGKSLLIMIDGFDEAEHGDLALAFTERAANAGIRVLVSSRTPLPEALCLGATTVSLADLSDPFARELLGSRDLSEADSDRLLSRYGSSPLILSVIARELSAGRLTAEMLLEIDPSTDLSKLLTHVTATLSHDARRLLQQLAADPPRAPDDACHQFDRTEDEAAMSELEERGLIRRVQGEPRVIHEAIRDWVRKTPVTESGA